MEVVINTSRNNNYNNKKLYFLKGTLNKLILIKLSRSSNLKNYILLNLLVEASRFKYLAIYLNLFRLIIRLRLSDF